MVLYLCRFSTFGTKKSAGLVGKVKDFPAFRPFRCTKSVSMHGYKLLIGPLLFFGIEEECRLAS